MDHQLINRAAREAKVPEVALAQIDELGFLGTEALTAGTACLPQPGRIDRTGVGARGERRHRWLRRASDPGPASADHACANHRPARSTGDSTHGREEHFRDRRHGAILTSDRKRARYLKQNYGVNWRDSSLYDLIVNSTRVPPDAATDCIIELLSRI